MKKLIHQWILTISISLPIGNIVDNLDRLANNTSVIHFILVIFTGIGLAYASWIIAGNLLKNKNYGRK